MKIKKIVAAIAAAALAVSMTAVNAFAATVTFGDYPGDWGASTTIPKAEFAAVGGDVKVVLELEQKAPLVGDINSLLKPMNICANWDAITTTLSSDTAYAKGDGFIVVPKDVTTIEFVVPESVWSGFVPYEGEEGDGSAGLAFQVCHVNIKSATLSAGSAQGAFKTVSEEESKDLMVNGAPAAEAAPEASTDAPATGNAPIAAMAVVMALAGAAAVASKKN